MNNECLEPLIFTIRGQRVVLDADLARLYGIKTFRLNEAFKRNRRRFPPDFAFQLTDLELEDLRSQSAISSAQDADSSGHGGRRYLPWAFTEHGALMAANILRSDRAMQMSVFVVRAFVRLRKHVAANTAVMARLAEILRPPADPPKRRIGFHTDDQ